MQPQTLEIVRKPPATRRQLARVDGVAAPACGRRITGEPPRRVADSSASRPSLETSPLRGSCLRDVPVLVVEDDPLNAKLVAIVMRSEGCDVHISRSAEDALAVLPIFRPRVIVLDLVLPAMSGVTLARRVKDDTATRDILIIAITAFDGRHVERGAMAAGCAACLAKPIDSSALSDLVLAHLRGNSA